MSEIGFVNVCEVTGFSAARMISLSVLLTENMGKEREKEGC